MNAPNASFWTIEELTAQVVLALSTDYEGPGNGRARELPDLRTVRYYTTLGLLDRPAAMRGRTALYSRRHLLQLVAIKRLQAKGHTLAELQERLVGMTDAELAEAAKLPAVGTTGDMPQTRTEAFWTQRPAGSASHESLDTMAKLPTQGIPLTANVTLLLTPSRSLDDDDVEAIRTVAAPLLKLLEKRRLVGKQPPNKPHWAPESSAENADD